MRMKVHGGTARGEGNLCTTCSHSTITRGQKLDDEIVDCRVFGLGHRRVTFRVTSCTAYHDQRLPSLMQLMDDAWVLAAGVEEAARRVRQGKRAAQRGDG